jgi:hypothetical protein
MTQPQNITKTAYHHVCDMEEPLRAVKNFARMIGGFAQSLDNSDDACAVQEVAYQIADPAVALEERRAEAFRLLHPNREQVAAIAG